MELNLTAPINTLGYGVAGMNILKALWNYGVEVSLFPISGPESISVSSKEDHMIVQRSLDLAKNGFNPEAASVRLWHQFDLAQHVGRGKHIGFPIFELDTFTKQELHHMRSCDELMVCSEWAKGVIQDHGLGNTIHVVPLGVNNTIFRPSNNIPRPRGHAVFFNCGKWEVRKGHDILIKAFKMAYEKNPNIELWMMCHNPFNSIGENEKWESLYSHPGVKLIPRAETQEGVYNMMAQADCGVFPSRGEGWNLELLEMMSVGRHVIATNYSAHREFCNAENSTLIDINNVELAYDNKWFFGQGKWANINEDTISNISSAMLAFAANHTGAVSEAGINTASEFTWHNTANKLIEGVLWE
jgi:glycosyltransferase involved in cell wall biosynthesis